jgi:hypothetical protein
MGFNFVIYLLSPIYPFIHLFIHSFNHSFGTGFHDVAQTDLNLLRSPGWPWIHNLPPELPECHDYRYTSLSLTSCWVLIALSFRCILNLETKYSYCISFLSMKYHDVFYFVFQHYFSWTLMANDYFSMNCFAQWFENIFKILYINRRKQLKVLSPINKIHVYSWNFSTSRHWLICFN